MKKKEVFLFHKHKNIFLEANLQAEREEVETELKLLIKIYNLIYGARLISFEVSLPGREMRKERSACCWNQ